MKVVEVVVVNWVVVGMVLSGVDLCCTSLQKAAKLSGVAKWCCEGNGRGDGGEECNISVE